MKNFSKGLMEETIKNKIKKILGKNVSKVFLIGKGACNYAYYIETLEGDRYIVKKELEKKEFTPQNSLLTEVKIAQFLNNLDLSIPIAKIAFFSEKPEMYGYDFIEGDTLKTVWNRLSEEEKISICGSLGRFHAEIGKKKSKRKSIKRGIKIDLSTGLHPETLEEYKEILDDAEVPETFKNLAKKAKEIFDKTNIKENAKFQFIHNDAHHENVLVKDGQISGFIDYGNTEYGEIAKEFSRYIRDFPDYFRYIVASYEKISGNKLSYSRLVANSFLSGLIDNVESYKKGNKSKDKAVEAIKKYKELILQIEE